MKIYNPTTEKYQEIDDNKIVVRGSLSKVTVMPSEFKGTFCPDTLAKGQSGIFDTHFEVINRSTHAVGLVLTPSKFWCGNANLSARFKGIFVYEKNLTQDWLYAQYTLTNISSGTISTPQFVEVLAEPLTYVIYKL